MQSNAQAEAYSLPSKTNSPAPSKKTVVVQRLIVLFSAYRLDQYSDPEGFKINIGLVLEQYPIDTIRFVTDPRTGIQRTHEWPPSVANVVTACESHVANVAKQARFRNWGKRDDLLEAPRED